MTARIERREPHSDRAQRALEAWGARYTRGIPTSAADDRRAELRSDVWEQRESGRWHHCADRAVAWSIVSRMLRGVPADLAWRRGQLARLGVGRPPVSRLTAAWTGRISVALAALIASGALALALYAVIRTMTAGLAALVPETAKYSLLVAVVALSAGLALLRNPRQRWVGALWIGVGAVIAIRAAATTLVVVSDTVRSYASAAAVPFGGVTLAGLALFFVVLAVSWRLERRATR